MRTSSSVNHLAPRPLRRCRSASPALRSNLLTAEQQILLRKSFSNINKKTLGHSIYVAMTHKCPELPRIFGANCSEVERHERYFVDLIQSTIDNLVDLEGDLKSWLLIGRAHAGFAIRSKHWDAFGEALVSSVTEWIGPGRQHKETIRAWMILASFVADRLSAAANSTGSPFSTPRIQLMTLVSSGPNTPL
ncbi:GLOBIN domain-containing protein [Aphelenchoides besseyi]|nr:GLOBIN domain-containing protein [Aphelenchoides besseyi]KAI6232405.1 GLOBIN domain-containing protein [Aphelenchoides besseyi]